VRRNVAALRRSRPASARLAAARPFAASAGRAAATPLGSAQMPVNCRRLLAVDSEAAPEVRIRADLSASVHAVRLVHPRHEEDQPDARILNEIFVRLPIRSLARRSGMSTVHRRLNLHEPEPIAVRRTGRPSQLPVARARKAKQQ
jgi:hypothetical protein